MIPIGVPQPEHWTIVSLWLAPRGVNGASSKLCPAHFGHVEIAIFNFLFSAELHLDIIDQGQSARKRCGAASDV
jgi:hypothetical protein